MIGIAVVVVVVLLIFFAMAVQHNQNNKTSEPPSEEAKAAVLNMLIDIERPVFQTLETIEIMIETKDLVIAKRRYTMLQSLIAELAEHRQYEWYERKKDSATRLYLKTYPTRTIYKWHNQLLDNPSEQLCIDFYCNGLLSMASRIAEDEIQHINSMVQKKAIENRQRLLFARLNEIRDEMDSICSNSVEYPKTSTLLSSMLGVQKGESETIDMREEPGQA